MKHIFIINPTSGKTNKSKYIQVIKDYCESKNIDYVIHETQYEKHAIEIAQSYQNTDSILYALGGDGTAYEVINGLKNCAFSVIPLGTGNDFFKMIDENKNIEQLIKDTIDGNITYIDYATCNGKVYLSSTSVGIDARVNDTACTLLKKYPIPKPLLYAVAAVMNIFNPNPFHVKIKMDDKMIEVNALLISVMNGKFYGNGVSPVKHADIQDGLLNICVVENVKFPYLLYCLPHYFLGSTSKIKQIKTYDAKHIEIICDKPLVCQSDGENFISDKLIIDVHPNALAYQKSSHSYIK